MAITSKRTRTSKTSNKETKKMSVATAPASTEPGTEGKVKQEKIQKVAHPALKVDDDGDATVQLESVPEDYSKKKHLPLRKKDFKDTSVFYLWRADLAEKQAKHYRTLAEEEKNLGSKEDRKKKKRLLRLQEQIDALKGEFEADGVDVDDLLASLSEE